MDCKMNGQIGVLMKDFVSRAVELYNQLDTLPVYYPAKKEALDSLKNQTIPVSERPLQEVYTEMIREIYSNTLLAQRSP